MHGCSPNALSTRLTMQAPQRHEFMLAPHVARSCWWATDPAGMITRCQAQARQAEAHSLLRLPDAALSTIHDALVTKDADGFCVSHADAAAFRCTCKALHDVVVLPSTLKLSFPMDNFMLATPVRSFSLAKLLSTPAAANTKLSLCFTDSEENGGYNDGDDGIASNPLVPRIKIFKAINVLRLLGDRLVCLDSPCNTSIEDTLVFIARHTPHVQHLSLRLFYDSCTASFFTENVVQQDRVTSDMKSSALSILELIIPPDSAPFVFGGGVENERLPLHLHHFPELEHVVLRGPIIKRDTPADSNEEHPFLLQPHVKVTIDPGLCGRQPTQWARSLVVYDRFDAMPASAVPQDREYNEEDKAARDTRIQHFIGTITTRAVALNDGRDRYALTEYVGGYLEDLDVLMRYGRSHGLLRYNLDRVAGSILQYYKEDEAEREEEEGYFCHNCGCYH